MRYALLALLVVGCDGYHCEGPACPVDAGPDAGVDAGVRIACSANCGDGCCDGTTGRCVSGHTPASPAPTDATCPAMAGGSAFCVSCATDELCGATSTAIGTGSRYTCYKRTNRCPGCLGCCNAVLGECRMGNEEAACGMGGEACRDCGAGMTCRFRACVTYP